MTTTLFTGLPRSGTTLVCVLLNEFQETIALAEPMSPSEFDGQSSVAQINRFIKQTRHSAVHGRVVTSQQVHGEIVDNFAEDPGDNPTNRSLVAQLGPVQLDKQLTRKFHLYIKQPAWFTALAPTLKQHFEMFVIVRNPLAMLASWQTVSMAIQQGYWPMASRFDKNLEEILSAEPDVLRRQIAIIEWGLNIFLDFPPQRIIKYEELIKDPARILSLVHPHARKTKHAIFSESPMSRYPNVDFDRLKTALKPIAALVDKFYPGFSQTIDS